MTIETLRPDALAGLVRPVPMPELSPFLLSVFTARDELAEAIAARDERRRNEEREGEEKEPAMAPSIPGRTYDNPNEDEEYEPPNRNEERALDDYEDDEEDDEDEEDDLDDEEDDED